jgi:HK97 gp10 family phage protein
MRVKMRMKITNDRLPPLRREGRNLGRSAPPATPFAPAGNLRAQAEAIAEEQGVAYDDVLAELCRIQAIRARLGPSATELDVASCLAAELDVTLEALLEASGLEMDEELSDAGGLDVGSGLPGLGGGDGLSAAVRGAAASTVAKAALEMQAEARRLAPVRTGRLRDSIRARQLGPTSWVVEIGVDYGGYVEFGTSRAPARPYMRPAFEKVKAKFGDLAAKEFDAAIARAAR